MIKVINKLNKKDENKKEQDNTPKPPSQEELLTEIRDLLRNK